MLLRRQTEKGWSWKYVKNTATISCTEEWCIADSDPFFEMMNVAPTDRDRYKDVEHCKYDYDFPNVWNRRELFLHASFVTSSAQGYLGRGGEFYTQPNKIYYTDFPTKQFFVEVSLDGYHPLPLRYENWILELTFLIDEEEHVGN
jgi:hypothetical protein